MSIEEKWCKVKIFHLQSMSNVITFIYKRFAVKKGVWYWYLTWAIQERQSACKTPLPASKNTKQVDLLRVKHHCRCASDQLTVTKASSDGPQWWIFPFKLNYSSLQWPKTGPITSVAAVETWSNGLKRCKKGTPSPKMGYLFLNIRIEELKPGSFFIFLFKFKLGNFPKGCGPVRGVPCQLFWKKVLIDLKKTGLQDAKVTA